MKFSAHVFAVSIGLLSGCSTISNRMSEGAQSLRNYTEAAASEPHALVRISTDSQVILEPSGTCVKPGDPTSGVAIVGGGLYVGASGYRGQTRGVPGAGPDGLASAEMRVSASSALAFSYNATWIHKGYERQCVVWKTFAPEAGASYQIVLRRNEVAGACEARVFKLAPEPVLVPTVPAKYCD